MKKLFYFATAAIVLSSCAASKAPLTGFIYSDVKAPLTATNNNASTLVGTAEAVSILGAVAQGDASIDAAAKSAGITKIHHIDEHSTNILGIIAKYKVVVYGE